MLTTYLRIQWLYCLGAFLVAFVMMAFFLFDFREVQATPPGVLTVCASGCDETSIGDAFTTANGDGTVETILVNEGYDPSADTNSTFPRSGLTLTCASSDVVIGSGGASSLTLVSTTTIQNCAFNRVDILGTTVENVTIDNNTFATSTFSKVSFTSLTSSTISNNTGFQYFSGAFVGGTFSGNMISIYDASGVTSYPVDFNPITDATITDNVITLYDQNLNAKPLIFLRDGSTNVVLSNNILSTSMASPMMGGSYPLFGYSGGGAAADLTLQNNIFSYQDFTSPATCRSVEISGNSDVSMVISNNTFSWYDNCVGILFSGSNSAVVTSTYNLFYNAGAVAAGTGIQKGVALVGPFSLFNNYNGYYSLAFPVRLPLTLDSQYKTGNPFFRRANASTLDDWELAPFSDYLDVFDTEEDIGAKSGIRASDFIIDDDGTVNYLSIHATSTDMLVSARSGDTVTLNAGTYADFSIDIDDITVQGAGPGQTVVSASGATSTLRLNASNVSVANMTLQDADTVTGDYYVSRFHVDYNENSYTDGILPAQGLLVFTNANDCSARQWVGDDGLDISAYLSDPLENVHVAAISYDNMGVYYLTALIPDYVASSTETMTTFLGGCAPPLTLDKFIPNVFVVNGSQYEYDGVALANNSVSLSDGYTNPQISIQNQTGYAGLYVSGSDNIISTLTLDNNGYGVIFVNTADGNAVQESTISNSILYDVASGSSGVSNSLQNTAFDTDSVSVTNNATVDVSFKVRASVVNASSAALSGVGVTFTSLDESQEAILSTNIMGNTNYSGYLQAFVLSSSSVAITNGGYNPYTVITGEKAGYQATSTEFNLNTRNQTVNVVMLPTVPTAPTDIEFINISINSMKVGWTDASSNEDNFIFDYIQSTDVADFPGATSSLDADVTSSTASGLTPNSAYMFRVAATNAGGTSAYVTSSVRYTTPNSPTKPTATATGQTTVALVWTANNNPDGTVYQIYNVTTDAVFATTTATSTTVTGLTANTSYVFAVRAIWVEDNAIYSVSPNSDSVTTDAVSSNNNSPGGGGGSATPVGPSVPGSGSSGGQSSEALILNGGKPTTKQATISVHVTASGAKEMAISESSSFAGASFVPFAPHSYFTLSSGAGKKTVYVKLRSAQGGETIVSGSITYQPTTSVDQDAPSSGTITSCPLTIGKAYKAVGSPAVYYVSASSNTIDTVCTKRPFARSQIFFTYFDSWSEVQVVPQSLLDSISSDILGFMPWGPKFDPKYGALVKTVNDPKVYLLIGAEKYWITSELVFVALGYQWNWIEDVDERLLDAYITGTEISYLDHHPNYTLVKYTNSPKVYRLEPDSADSSKQVKRHIVSESVFISLNFRWDRIVTILNSEQYPDGLPLK